jgi:DNA-binding CsgD family transcriptional regulator
VTAKLQADNWADREARAQQLSEELTPRQKEGFSCSPKVRQTKEIADILSVSERTVMFHKYRMMKTSQKQPRLHLARAQAPLISYDSLC